ncbi:MarR family winged helix-turn-helix transcriptional regulator [Pseudonocardia zijingensis]|uniref:MarR family winged helix-turn-helix transcriptional regulator n=2 Tax=Pseudonocardia zijingensis TaxID=153376 RepID=A0ABP4AP02_9PSEU
MSTPEDVDAAVRQLMLVFPRLVGRVKKLPPPPALRSLELTPRHLSLLSMLLLDGPLTVSELAERLSVAPTTVSLLVGELSGKGVLRRRPDPADRRRRIVDLDDEVRPAVSRWLAPGARAWREALGPLTPAERRVVVDTLLAYEAAVTRGLGAAPAEPR